MSTATLKRVKPDPDFKKGVLIFGVNIGETTFLIDRTEGGDGTALVELTDDEVEILEADGYIIADANKRETAAAEKVGDEPEEPVPAGIIDGEPATEMLELVDVPKGKKK